LEKRKKTRAESYEAGRREEAARETKVEQPMS
jgi:hypothetical protein